MSFVRQHKGAILSSVALHVAVVTALSMGIHLPSRQRAAVAAAPIQGVIVDQAILERETQRREQTVRQEQQRRQRDERQRRDAERARTEAEQQERERVVQQQRDKERAVEQERVAAEKRRQEQATRDQQQRETREREAAVARRAQQQAESELQQALASEQERQSAERAGLLDQYIADIENQIERRWNQPLSVRPGLDCIVDVVQLPSGDVMSAKVSSCNGDEAVVRSIERAVMDASPLPKPPSPALFDRSLHVRFHPDL